MNRYQYLPKELQKELDGCNRDLCAVVDELNERQFAALPPKILYQYTDAKGLRGILNSGTVWLTDVLEQKDPSEVYHGVEIGAQALSAAAAKELHPTTRLFARQVAENQRELVQHSARYYIACFARVRDDMDQWRAYGAGGNGFALGFDGPALEKAFQRSAARNNCTIAMNYTQRPLKQAAVRLASIVLPRVVRAGVHGLRGHLLREWIVTLQTDYSSALLRAAILFKHPSYRHESEYRLMHVREAGATRSGELRRKRGASTAWYIGFVWKTGGSDLLKQVVTGPLRDEADSARLVSRRLKEAGIDPRGVKIPHSKVPLRR
jgi:Protein of unknown function (DUF2971)